MNDKHVHGCSSTSRIKKKKKKKTTLVKRPSSLHHTCHHCVVVTLDQILLATVSRGGKKRSPKKRLFFFFSLRVCRQSQLMRHKQTFHWEQRGNKNLTKMCSKCMPPFQIYPMSFKKKKKKKHGKVILNNLLRFIFRFFFFFFFLPLGFYSYFLTVGRESRYQKHSVTNRMAKD